MLWSCDDGHSSISSYQSFHNTIADHISGVGWLWGCWSCDDSVPRIPFLLGAKVKKSYCISTTTYTDLSTRSAMLNDVHFLALLQDYPGAQMKVDLSKLIDRTRVWLDVHWTVAALL
jgi:hypothetical protein